MALDLESLWLLAIERSLRVFDGWCLELADEVGQWLWRQGIKHLLVYIEPLAGAGVPVVARYPSGDKRWKYHAVLLANGLIHDAWRGKAMDPFTYFAEVFPGQDLRVEYRSEDPRKDFEIMEIWRNGKRVSMERQ